ncbi:MAG: ABC transporter permease [Bryobacterales bacterium]|nr:ABC transporter permease [Bryobacterales bacterium]
MKFPWKRSEDELEREIAHHLYQLAAEYERQGHSREEALRLARREFGYSGQVKEQCRDERRWAWMSGLRQDIVFGIRMMRRSPVVTVAAVLSLALGIGANTAIFSLTDLVLWRRLPLPQPEQLSLVNWQAAAWEGGELADSTTGSMMDGVDGGVVADFFSYPAFEAMQERVAGLASVAAYTYPRDVSVGFAGHPAVARRRTVSGNFLSTLGVKTVAGRLISINDDRAAAPMVAVVSHRFWKGTLNAETSALGQTITIDNRPYELVGVLEPGYYGLMPGDVTDIYTPMAHAATGDAGMQDNRHWGISLLARRAPGVSEAQLQPAMQTAFSASWSKERTHPDLTPQIRLDEGARGLGSLRREFRNPLYVLGGLVGLLLVIACVNIANLLLARATARQKEVALRVSMGCSRSRLMRQFLTESALLAALGGIASIVVAVLTVSVLSRFLGGRDEVPVEVALDFRIFATVSVLTGVALLLFGLFPAWRGSRKQSADWLKEGSGSLGSASRHRWGSGRVLVLAQMAMAIVLVMSAVLFTRNLLAIQSADPGFDRQNLILFGVRPGTSGYHDSQLPGFYAELERRLSEVPGVKEAGLAAMRPMNIGGWWQRVRLEGETELQQASINGITPNYLPLYTPGVIAGRNLTWADVQSDAKVVVISEDLALKWGGLGVLGRKLVFDRRRDVTPVGFEIVGIAPTIAATSMKQRPYAVWRPLDKGNPLVTAVLRTTQPPIAVLPLVRETMAGIDSRLPMIETVTMEDQIARGLHRERMFATLCMGFGILALVLTAVGLYGVIAYSTTRRRREIGVRLALGAVPADVLLMVLREGLVLAVLGILAGIPIVWTGAKYVEKELYQMKPLEPASFAIALGALLSAAVLAVGIPALRASSLQPTDALREE